MRPFCLLFLFVAGCPLPPEDGARSGSNQGVQRNNNANGQPGGQFAGAPGAQNQASQNGPKGAGPQKEIQNGELMDLSSMQPQQSQEELKAAEHITVSGTVSGDCAGVLRIDVINTQIQGPGEDGKEPGPLASISMNQSGPFSIAAPKGQSIKLTAICDVNRDEKLTEGIDLLSMESRLGVLEADQAGVELALADIKPGGGPGAGAPAGGKGAGGPGAQPNAAAQ